LSHEVTSDCDSGNGPSLPVSPVGKHIDNGTAFDFSTLPSDLAVSLCGGLKEGAINPDNFRSCLLKHDEWCKKLRDGNVEFMHDPNLVVRMYEKYLSWGIASPILMSLLLFKKPLPNDIVEGLIKDGQDVNLSMPMNEGHTQLSESERNRKKSSWFGWFGTGEKKVETSENSKNHENTESITINAINTEEKTELNLAKETIETENSSSSEELLNCTGKRYIKTLRLRSSQLSSLSLRQGRNEVQFSVTTAFQGTTTCVCHIYLWHHTDKIVISDIDGTITKSDVFGHLLPLIGQDWTQSGVTQLYSKIHNNGYKIMYLSARAIGHSSITKDYLSTLKQGDIGLPHGPVFLNPDSLINAVRREVIDRNPEEFKIQCLEDIQPLFEGKQPFFAGYGNRPNDACAYKHVGIFQSRIFTINPAGELSLSLTPTQSYQTSYGEQDVIVDMVFPSPVSHSQSQLQRFSNFEYWNYDVMELTYEQIDIVVNQVNCKSRQM